MSSTDPVCQAGLVAIEPIEAIQYIIYCADLSNRFTHYYVCLLHNLSLLDLSLSWVYLLLSLSLNRICLLLILSVKPALLLVSLLIEAIELISQFGLFTIESVF
jgi:hypothetical protein